MHEPHFEHKLVAILAADVVGYSRHMEQDEVPALATLTSHRLLIEDLVARHGGAGVLGECKRE